MLQMHQQWKLIGGISVQGNFIRRKIERVHGEPRVHSRVRHRADWGLEQCRQSSTYSFYSVMVKHQWSLHQVKSGSASQLLILPRTRVWNFPTMILVRCCPRSTDKNAPTSSSFPSSFYYNPPHSPRPQMLRPPCLP